MRSCDLTTWALARNYNCNCKKEVVCTYYNYFFPNCNVFSPVRFFKQIMIFEIAVIRKIVAYSVVACVKVFRLATTFTDYFAWNGLKWNLNQFIYCSWWILLGSRMILMSGDKYHAWRAELWCSASKASVIKSIGIACGAINKEIQSG